MGCHQSTQKKNEIRLQRQKKMSRSFVEIAKKAEDLLASDMEKNPSR